MVVVGLRRSAIGVFGIRRARESPPPTRAREGDALGAGARG